MYILPAGIDYADSGKPWPLSPFTASSAKLERIGDIFLERLVTIGAMSGLFIAEFKGCSAKGTEGL